MCLFLKRICLRKRNDFLISEAQWRIWSCLDILLCYLWSKAVFFQNRRADLKKNYRLSEFARSLDEQRQKTIIVRRDVIRGSDCMGSSTGGGCGRPATIRIMPPMSTMTATSMRTATMSTTITMLSAPHCSHMVWSFCVGTQSPCREQRNRILSRIFGKTYVGGRDNANCFIL